MRLTVWKKIKKRLRRIPLLATLSDFIYPFRDQLRVWTRKNLRQRAYPKDYFERLFETRRDPWQYEGDHQQERLHLLLSFIPESTNLALEIGCAEGSFTHLLLAKCKRVIALDLSMIALRRAKSRTDADKAASFIQADLLKLPFSSCFPAIVCAGVLVYFSERKLFELAAAQIYRILEPGGFLILENMWERSGGSIAGQVIHDHFRSIPGLDLVKSLKHKEYGISVFQRKADLVLPAEPAVAFTVQKP